MFFYFLKQTYHVAPAIYNPIDKGRAKIVEGKG